MIFSASATHALRALAHLAAEEGEVPMLGRDLASEIGVPAHYLAKVLGTLARAGLLAASRGVHGGYRLARPAREIKLIEVVAPFEGTRVRPGCLLRPDRPCREDAACAAHTAWSEVKVAYSAFLETTTLADIQGGGPAQAGKARTSAGTALESRASASAPATAATTSAELSASAVRSVARARADPMAPRASAAVIRSSSVAGGTRDSRRSASRGIAVESGSRAIAWSAAARATTEVSSSRGRISSAASAPRRSASARAQAPRVAGSGSRRCATRESRACRVAAVSAATQAKRSASAAAALTRT